MPVRTGTRRRRFDRFGRGTPQERGRGSVVGPLAGSRGFTAPTGEGVRGTATAQPKQDDSAEGRAAAAGRRSLSRGSDIQMEGVRSIQDFDPMDFLGADALSAIFDQATISNFLPQLRGLQSRNAQRGVRGPLAGALEGDLMSGFQRNLLSTAGQFGSRAAGLSLQRGQSLAEIGGTERAQGLSLLGTELELELAREQAEKEKRSGIAGMIGAGLGAAAGSFIPGIGTAAGMAAGSAIGGGIGRSLG